MALSLNHSAILKRVEDYFVGAFSAMANPCQVLIDTDDPQEATAITHIAEEEAQRIESKFSRYRSNNIVDRINRSDGKPVQVDQEAALLIDYAKTCYDISDGMFDITSGVLRRAWKFDGSSHVPGKNEVEFLLKRVGWWRVRWDGAMLSIPSGMEIDFGGIGKEYAVDRTAHLIAAKTHSPFLVNYGGDLFASGLRRGNRTWAVGIDDPERTGEAALYRLDISRAGLATTGDARRYVLHEGKRLSHILNPKTGWPVVDAPRSVTVVARTCLEAGTLSTIAFLQGPNARKFLEDEGVQFWIL